MMKLIATAITSRSVDLNWKHAVKTKTEGSDAAFYKISKGDIDCLEFEVCYEGKDKFCILTDLKPATRYEILLRTGELNANEEIIWSNNIDAELEFITAGKVRELTVT